MAKIVVLGAGLVGGVMAKDLSETHEVTSIDISQRNLDKLTGIKTICADISDKNKLQKVEQYLAELPSFSFQLL